MEKIEKTETPRAERQNIERPQKHNLSIRIDQSLRDRLDALAPFIVEKSKEEISRLGLPNSTGLSFAVRTALEIGVREIEREKAAKELGAAAGD